MFYYLTFNKSFCATNCGIILSRIGVKRMQMVNVSRSSALASAQSL